MKIFGILLLLGLSAFAIQTMVMPKLNAAPSCWSEKDCQKGTCFATEARCDGQVFSNPKGEGYQGCSFVSQCIEQSKLPTEGCFGVITKGEYKRVCLGETHETAAVNRKKMKMQ